MGRDGGIGIGVAVQVEVLPAQCPGFLGADPGQQAQRDVGVHQLSGPAYVLQARAQLDGGQGRSGADDRDGLLQGQRPRRPAFLAFGGIHQGSYVAGNEAVGFGGPDRAFERQVAHGYRRAGVVAGHRR
jgi:hypothetical protein